MKSKKKSPNYLPVYVELQSLGVFQMPWLDQEWFAGVLRGYPKPPAQTIREEIWQFCLQVMMDQGLHHYLHEVWAGWYYQYWVELDNALSTDLPVLEDIPQY